MAKLKIHYPNYQQPSIVTFGSGSLRALADAGEWNATALLLSSQTRVRELLGATLAKCHVTLDGIPCLLKPSGEPTVEMIVAGAAWLRRHRVERLIAIGGGSVLDWARLCWAHAVELLTLATGKVAAVDRRHHRPEIVLVPSTCGTGAEAAGVAVYSHDGRKLAAVSRAFLADRVILDARFLESIQEDQLSCFLCDALSHAIEAYVSLVPNYLAKESALSALRIILDEHDAQPGTCRNERLLEAGYLGGVAAANCSVGIVHAFAHALSFWNVPHGFGNALALVAGIRANAETDAMLRLVARLGLENVEQLAQRVEPVVRKAAPAGLPSLVVARLENPREREALVQRMLGDVCIRTNPRPVDAALASRFVDDVAAAFTTGNVGSPLASNHDA